MGLNEEEEENRMRIIQKALPSGRQVTNRSAPAATTASTSPTPDANPGVDVYSG
jgi:hypothetical protein